MTNGNNLVIVMTGTATLVNTWGAELKRVYLRHIGAESRAIEYKKVQNGMTISEALRFRYQLGWSSPKDYWYMEIETLSGELYKTKESFYCSINGADFGKVIIEIDGSSKDMLVKFPQSSDCSTSLNLSS